MVTIINYKQRQKEDGTSFYALEIQGGVEMVRSKETGQFYATAKRASITSTFDEATCNTIYFYKIVRFITDISINKDEIKKLLD